MKSLLSKSHQHESPSLLSDEGPPGFDARAGAGCKETHARTPPHPERAEQAQKGRRLPNSRPSRREGGRTFERRRWRRGGRRLLQCIFGYHCHRDEWLTEKDLSHVSLPHGTMLQRQNTHYGRRGGRESRKQNKGNTVSTERPWPDMRR